MAGKARRKRNGSGKLKSLDLGMRLCEVKPNFRNL